MERDILNTKGVDAEKSLVFNFLTNIPPNGIKSILKKVFLDVRNSLVQTDQSVLVL